MGKIMLRMVRPKIYHFVNGVKVYGHHRIMWCDSDYNFENVYGDCTNVCGYFHRDLRGPLTYMVGYATGKTGRIAEGDDDDHLCGNWSRYSGSIDRFTGDISGLFGHGRRGIGGHATGWSGCCANLRDILPRLTEEEIKAGGCRIEDCAQYDEEL